MWIQASRSTDLCNAKLQTNSLRYRKTRPPAPTARLSFSKGFSEVIADQFHRARIAFRVRVQGGVLSLLHDLGELNQLALRQKFSYGGNQMRTLLRSLFVVTISLTGLSAIALAQESGGCRFGPGQCQELRADRREIRGDRRELRGDGREIRQDRRETRSDVREYRQDRRDGASRQELRADRHEIRGDQREVRGDRGEFGQDRRDLRGDRRDFRRDRRDARH